MKKIILIFLFCHLLGFVIYSQEAKKIDEISSFYCDDLKAHVDYFISEIAQNSESKGYVIVYEGKVESFNSSRNGRKYILPRIGEANSRIELIKLHLKWRLYPLRKIIFVNGGFRENLTAEFWIIPKDADLPVQTPTLKRIKHRRGKVPKLQMGDC